MRLRLNPLAQNGLSVVEPTIVNSTTSSSTTGGGTVPTSVDDLSPSQTGNAGKFLKTDGTNATWEAIPGGGDMLTTNNLSDLTDTSIARTNLGVDAAGTDNSTNVTLAGTGTYISLTGQQITVDPITESDITDLNHAVDVVSNVATSTILGRVTAGSGNSEELTAAQVRTLINVADGATANSSDATLLARANHTGTQSADTITDGTTNKAYTATEQSKLAGIESGATADQSASEILTAIKTVDGTTSGLDADLLDGNEATAFATSAQGALADSAVQPIDLATVATTGSYSDLSSTPTLGTAAAKNIPATGDASATEVVYGTDTRLTNARTPTAHTHTASAVTDFDTAVAANSAVAANTAKVGVTTQISNVVEDTTPQLGGNLDSNGHNIQVKGTNGILTISSDTDGGDFNIGSNASGTLAIYGSAGNTLNVDLLDGNLSLSGGGTVDGRDVSADGSKLDGIETGADVTDATNVAAAGAVMDGDFSSNGLMKRTAAGTYAIATAPTGDVVGTSDTQTLTNKTIGGTTNTLIDIGQESLQATHAFKATLSGAQSTTGGVTAKIGFNTETYDLGSNFNTTTSRFVAPFTGIYHIGARVQQPLTATPSVIIYLYKNGSQHLILDQTQQSVYRVASGATDISLAATDYVEIFFTSSASDQIEVDSTEFYGHLIGRTD